MGVPENWVGKEFHSWHRTITEGDFTLLLLSTWTIMPVHTDKEYMKSSPFGGTIMAGVCTLAVIAGLITTTSGILRFFEQENTKSIAILGYDSVRFLAPVKTGDTIRAKAEIMQVTPTSKFRRFILKTRDIGYNQTDEVVLEAVRNYLMEQEA